MSLRNEIISIHVGQAGCQVGNSCWEMYCLEHNVRSDGIIRNESQTCPPATFFANVGGNKVVPRALFLDLEPTVIDEIRTGIFRQLFNPKNLMTGKEDAANCFARGYFTLGKDFAESAARRLRSVVEECNHLQGFFLFRAYGGGTGSGLMSRLLETISEDYPKLNKLEFFTYPAPKMSSVVVEPYNVAFATHLSLEHSTGSFMIDNGACYDICDRLLDVSSPVYSNINRLLGQVLSSVTASLRFTGDVNVDLSDIRTNLIPYPRIQYPIISYAPLLSKRHSIYENITAHSLIESCFNPSHQLTKCDPKKGKYIACTLLFRGDVANASVNAAMQTIRTKRASNFVEWCPVFKIGINPTSPTEVPGGDVAFSNRTCLLLGNSSAIRTSWERLMRKFDLMYAKKAFVHWYVSEGLEEADFQDTRLDLDALDEDYKEIEAL